jgi:putative lipoic acid-binding regulatory protein
MTEPASPSLLTFPCDFPVKVIGRKEPDFESSVLVIFRRHVATLPPEAVSTRDSGGGKFTALTVTVTATSQQQLDDLYRELSRAPAVLMAL